MKETLFEREIYILSGPTAVGKTELSLELARVLNAEILSADSMQVYRYFDIGTAKPTREERDKITHHCIDCVDPGDSFDVAQFVSAAEELIPQIWNREKNVLVVGGTMMYILRLVHGVFPEGERSDEVRSELQRQIDRNGPERLHAQLLKIDPESHQRISSRDARRIIRAWEVYILTGKSITHLQKDYREKRPPLKVRGIALIRDRDELYNRINKRTRKMFDQGLIGEVNTILGRGYPADIQPFEALAYKEAIQFLRKELSLQKAIHKARQETRNFAKRQLTWVRSFDFLKSLDITSISFTNQIDEALKLLQYK